MADATPREGRSCGRTPKFSCEHSTTKAAQPRPKSACLLQRSLGSGGAAARFSLVALGGPSPRGAGHPSTSRKTLPQRAKASDPGSEPIADRREIGWHESVQRRHLLIAAPPRLELKVIRSGENSQCVVSVAGGSERR